MNNIYKVGQHVRVIHDITKYDHLFGLTKEMIHRFADHEVTINFVSDTCNFDGSWHLPSNLPLPCDNCLYGIIEDNHEFSWSNTMFTVA